MLFRECAVDYDTRLIFAIIVIQDPSDYYGLSQIAERAILNIKTTPKYLSADTIYSNQISLSYLDVNNEWINIE